jgi:hypothetical protein
MTSNVNGASGVQQTCILFGNPSKAGLYGVVYNWWPGHFSKPHFRNQDRYAHVISGTRWVSTSNVYDERAIYPVHARTVSIDVNNAVHWDGARTGEKEPAVLELVGIGPAKTFQADENGPSLADKADQRRRIRLLSAIMNLGETRKRAGLVLLAARCARHGEGADQFGARLDRYRASAGSVDQGIGL